MVINTFLNNKRILITCGPTWVPLDGVRVLSNISSGELGHRIALNLLKAGARITLLQGETTHKLPPGAKIRVLKFQFFAQLQTLLKKELQRPYDIFIHAAAVSDFQPLQTTKGKIPSDQKNLNLQLLPTPKLINDIKIKQPKTFLVGFKLLTQGTLAELIKASKKLAHRANCDLVLANRFDSPGYDALILNKTGTPLAREYSKRKAAAALVRILRAHFKTYAMSTRSRKRSRLNRKTSK